MPRTLLTKGLLAGAAGGLVGSAVKALVEPPLQRVGEALMPPAPGKKELLGADTTGHPANMPPAELVRDVAPVPLRRDAVLEAQTVIHFAFGTAMGAAYGALAEATPIAWGRGVPAGAALFAATHGSVVPALGLQSAVGEMPRAWWVWELGSHLVYGLTADAVYRLVRDRL